MFLYMTEFQARLHVKDEQWAQSSETEDKGEVECGSEYHKLR
jgi:hypothetical protein